MKFDFSGMTQAMDKMHENAERQGKTLAEKMSGEFLKDVKAQSWMIAPTPEKITAKAKELKFRLIRKKGVSPRKELARRIRARGTFARKWKIWKTESRKYSVRIWIIDTAKESGKVDSDKGVSAKAEKITGKKYKTKLDQMASRVFNNF